MKVLLDANALMIPGRYRIPLFDEITDLVGSCEPIVLTSVLKELEGIARGCGSSGRAARLGLTLAQRCSIVEDGGLQERVDDAIVSFAQEHRTVVVTDDRALRRALMNNRVPVISVRARKKLALLQS